VSPAAVRWSLLYFTLTGVVLTAFAWVTNRELTRAVIGLYSAHNGIAPALDLLPVPLGKDAERRQPTLVPEREVTDRYVDA
jgi:hypothetical protein